MAEAPEFNEILLSEEKNYARNLLLQVSKLLQSDGWSLSCAESLTGGLLCEALTRLPKSSNFFMGGIVCYHPRIKVEAVGVDAALLRQFGAVSAPVAEAMALGVSKRLRTRIGLSTTGVAGPDPLNGMAVGTVFVGLCKDGLCKTQRLGLTGDRQEIRQASVLATLRLLRDTLVQVA